MLTSVIMADAISKRPQVSKTENGRELSQQNESEDTDWEIVDHDNLKTRFQSPVHQKPLSKASTWLSVPDLTSLDVIEEVQLTPEKKDQQASPTHSSRKTSPWGGTEHGLKKIPSFRDMLLVQLTEDEASSSSKCDTSSPTTPQQTTPSRRKVKPRFVVTPTMKRCSKSTNDIQSLLDLNGGHEGDAVLGDEDAMEYYHRKAKGISGRKNGLKIRPDEAKRKDISIQKREMQREASRRGK
mmetsp:Transcript_18337/g.26336  ORF Transcript_18337/g.26336 Transcript_18337/m.26336 type:complete len:240 (+) Transcript_18337:288-1007(+)